MYLLFTVISPLCGGHLCWVGVPLSQHLQQSSRSATEDNELEPGDAIYATFIPPEWEEQYIGAMDTPSQQLAQEAQKAEESQPLEDMVPVQYCDFRDVFSKEAFNELELWKAWDHAIDLTPGAEIPCSQTFPL